MTQRERDAALQANRVAAQNQLAHEVRVAQNTDRPLDECRALGAAIVAYDAEARLPLSAQRQDQLREWRKAARDRQFVLKCS